LRRIVRFARCLSDLSSWNCEFSDIYPALTTRAVNQLERDFLGALSYNLYVSGSTYARYYFGLRGLRDAPPPRAIPKHYERANFPRPLQRNRLGTPDHGPSRMDNVDQSMMSL